MDGAVQIRYRFTRPNLPIGQGREEDLLPTADRILGGRDRRSDSLARDPQVRNCCIVDHLFLYLPDFV
jgi:hypothetical protein